MKILVAVDGSPYTQKALDFLAANRKTFLDGQQLIVLHVSAGLPPHVTRHVTKEVVEDYYAEENAKVLDPVKAVLTTHGIADFVIEHREGHASDEIVAAAEQAGADLIVMGTRGHGTFGRALVGSVATRVISESHVSVLLVK